MKLLPENSPIYAICDREQCEKQGISLLEFSKAVTGAGIKILQYRDKISSKDQVRASCEKLLSEIDQRVCLILNDHADIAMEFVVPVHLGQNDGPAPRAVLALDFESDETDAEMHKRIHYGRSTHSIDQIRLALQEKPAPDYLGFGAIFNSSVKPENKPVLNNIPEAVQASPKDIVLIGGITLENLDQLPRQKNIYYAIISDFFSAGARASQVEQQARKLLAKALDDG